MHVTTGIARVRPLAFVGRLAIALTEISLALLVLASAVVVGHELKAWRDWYWDPATYHPWAPTPQPTPIISSPPLPSAGVEPAPSRR